LQRSTHLFPILVFLSVAASSAQSPAPATPDAVPTFKTNARAVVVDVVVTKGNDDPVAGLHQQDFQVIEDGKPQTVDFFEEHTVKPLPPGALKPLPPMPPNVYTNVPQAPESDAVNVLLLDSLNTEAQDQTFVHKQILAFLQGMQPGTRAAILTLGSQLRFIQGFTTDSSALLAAINDKKSGFYARKDGAYRSESDKEDDQRDLGIMMAMLGGRSDGGIDAMRQSMSDNAGFKASDRAMMTLEALDYLARYLADVPGRKNLIWFASSYPVTIFPSASQRQQLSDARIYNSAVKKTADLLTVSKVAVYPINAQGMMTDHIMDADSAGPGTIGNIQAAMATTVPYAAAGNERASTIFAMEELAADTGGKAFYNTNDLSAALQHAINDGSHYYTLVYTPTNKKLDGAYRHILVKLTSEKFHLSYRRGYNADDTSTAAAKPESDPLRPLLVRGLPSSTQLLFGVRVLPMTPQPPPNATRAGKNPQLTGPTTRYSVDFMVRWQDVKLTTTPQGTHSGTLQVGLLAYDRNGKPVNWAGATQGMNLSPDVFAAIQKSGVPAHAEIDLPNTDVYLETGVYDWGSGKAGTVEVPLRVGSDAAMLPRPTPEKTN